MPLYAQPMATLPVRNAATIKLITSVFLAHAFDAYRQR
jgi:hypothetical protein